MSDPALNLASGRPDEPDVGTIGARPRRLPGGVAVGRVLTLLAAFVAARADGASLSNFPKDAGGPVSSSPVAVSLEGGMGLEILVASGSRLACITASGDVCRGFPVDLGPKASIAGDPAAADLEGDGRPEVVVALTDGRIVAVKAGGGTRVLATAAVAGVGPTLADLDGDGRPEVVIGTRDGLLHAFRTRGGEMPGFPVRMGGAVTSAAAVGRIAGRLAVVVGDEDGRLNAIDAGGQPLSGFPVTTRFAISGQPAIADLDGDGENEIVAASQDFSLYAVRANGKALPGFPVDLGYRLYGGPALADLDGDGKLEIIQTSGDGKLHALSSSGREHAGFPLKIGDRVVAPAIAGDFDHDGRDEVAVCAEEGTFAVLHGNGREVAEFPAKLGDKCTGGAVAIDLGGEGWTALVVGNLGGSVLGYRVRRAGHVQTAMSWPMVGRDASRTGRRHPNPPRYHSLAVTPPDPQTDDALRATYHFAQADGEPEPKTIIRWWRNDKEVTELSGRAEVPAEMTTKGDRWRFSVQPRADAPPEKSPVVLIRDSAPGAPKVAVTPVPMTRGVAARVQIVEAARDPDGDALTYKYTWLRNGSADRRAGSEVPPGTFRRGEHWTVVVVASDGEREGPPAMADFTVANTAPTAPDIAFEPASPRIGDAIKLLVRRPATDVDDDAITYRYRWSVDGQARNYPLAASVFPAQAARKGQRVSVEVAAWDGQVEGPAVKAAATLVNTPPSAPVATIRPHEPRHGASLIGAVAAPAVDPDGDPVAYRYTWTRNGKPWPSDLPVVPASEIKKGDQWTLSVVANDGAADSRPAQAEVTIRNTPPSSPAISVADDSPLAGDAVAIRIDRPASDADGDPVTLEYAWEVEGKDAGLPRDALSLPVGKTRKGEHWTVTVTPRDGESSGEPAVVQFVPRNNPPQAAAVELAPSSPTVLTGMSAHITRPSLDRDQDAIRYRYAWFKNGRRLDLPQDVAQLKPGQVRGGDDIRVVVVPFDGEAEGPRAEAHATVGNTPPSAPEIAIEPAKPSAVDSLRCVIKKAATDPDGDVPNLRVTWSRDGQAVPAPPDAFALPKGTARHGEKWRCEVTASDATSTSPTVRAEVLVANTPPLAPAITIEPESPATQEQLTCRIAQEAFDADGDPITYTYRWTRNGRPYRSGGDPAVVPPSATLKGDRWRCEVVASDGQAQGPLAADERIIKNSPPSGASVRITPATPSAGATLRCEITQPASDPDGDRIQYRYRWLRNGVPQTFAPSSTEVPSRLVRPEDLWRCEVTPTDGKDDGPVAASDDILVGGETARASR